MTTPELIEISQLQQLVPPVEALIREPLRRLITGLSYTVWWRMEKAGRAPRRIKITGDVHGWKLSEVQAWVRERINSGPIPLEVYYGARRDGGD
jgi:predicted DNA-binding transcriptional regulator AlpA